MVDDKKDELFQQVEQNSSFCANGCFIVNDLFQVLEKEPDRYSFDTPEGIVHLKVFAERLAGEKVRSFRGTFQQAKLAGLCIASGWLQQSQFLTVHQQTEELLMIENALCIPEYAKLQQMGLVEENAIERSLVFGFRCGVRLGAAIRAGFRKSKKYPSVTTDYLLSRLKKINRQNGIAYPIVQAGQYSQIILQNNKEENTRSK